MTTKDSLRGLLAPIIEDLGFEFVGLEYSANPKNRLLRLYIDRLDGTLVNLDDCASVSREVSALLDVEEPVSGNYTLEVSSPGVERPLFNAAHFRRFIGHRAAVRMHQPVDGRRRFAGQIVKVDERCVTLSVDDRQVQLPLSGIDRAHLAPDMDQLFAERRADGSSRDQ